jgi:hypothetical protein
VGWRPPRAATPKPEAARGMLHDPSPSSWHGRQDTQSRQASLFPPLTLGEDNRQVMDESVGLRFDGIPEYRPRNHGFPLL